MILFEGYFDESGTNDSDFVQCVAGYIIESSAAESMTKDWIDLLNRYDLPHFHMVDCAHGAEHFSKYRSSKGNDIRSQIARSFIDLIKSYNMHGICMMFNPQTFGGISSLAENEETYSLYAECVDLLTYFSSSFLEPFSHASAKIALVFEKGHKNRGLAEIAIKQALNDPKHGERIVKYSFEEKAHSPLLQAADILAWQATKWVKCFKEGRNIRKDFLSLLEINHDFYHLYSTMMFMGEPYISTTIYHGSRPDSPDWPSVLSEVYGAPGSIVFSGFPMHSHPLKGAKKIIRSVQVDYSPDCFI